MILQIGKENKTYSRALQIRSFLLFADASFSNAWVIIINDLSAASRKRRGRNGRGIVFRRPRSHDLGLTHTLVTLLRSRIRRFTLIIYARWLRTNSKNYVEKSQTSPGKLGIRSTPKRVRKICPNLK